MARVMSVRGLTHLSCWSGQYISKVNYRRPTLHQSTGCMQAAQSLRPWLTWR